MKKILTSLFVTNLILFSGTILASENISLNYNIIPEISNGSVVDINHTKELHFSLFENEKELYYNNNSLQIEDGTFKISIENLKGKNEFTIKNSLGEEANFTYYISNEKDGLIENYELEEMKGKNLKTYIKTINNVSIIYTEKDKKSIKYIEEIIQELPDKMLSNLKEIKLIPANHVSKAAGITNYNKITLYNISSYSKKTIKNIVIHEITHTWAFKLMQQKLIDFSYTNYKQVVDNDRKFPSNYAMKNVKEGNYSEDFAESVSFYIINPKSFSKKYENRAEYIKELLEN